MMYRCVIALGIFASLNAGLSFAQQGTRAATCSAPNGAGPGSTNLYGTGNPCAFTYSLPPAAQIRLLQENPQCTMSSATVVNCSRAVAGNYGQTLIGPGAPRPTQPQYIVPATPPLLGVSPEQKPMAEQLWQRAAALIDQDRVRDAMGFLFKCAALGDARCQATLGIRFQDGSGVQRNDRAAVYWFSAAAAQGHRAAEFALGGMYEEGEGGLPRDLRKATELYIKSADQGFDRAKVALATQYELGQVIPRSRARAIELYRASGDQDALWIAQVLANPKTPARFAGETALDQYLAGVRSAEIAAAWARAHPGAGNSGGGMPHMVTADQAAVMKWEREGKNGPNPLSR
jgi:TPR repeat protein